MNKKRILIVIIGFATAVLAVMTYIYNQKIQQETNQKESMNNTIEVVESKMLDNTDDGEIKDGFLGILQIDKINMKGLVKEGSNSEVLKDYIGHIENTPKYDGNVCLAAHNRGNIYSYFANINKLEMGDEIKYKTVFGENVYEVNKKEEIDEQDWNMLEDTEENKITLITCIKNKRSKRLCVQATRKEFNNI